MSARILFVSVGLVVACAVARAEEPQRGTYPMIAPTAVPTAPPPARTVVPPIPPAERSVEDLLTTIENLRAQKAELAKLEAELTAALGKKLQQQTERLQKLGIAPKDAKPAAPEPDRVGRIIIEGNVKTPDRKILANVDLRPGQILRYPAIEETRAKLEKAGFKGATVEVLPNELDGNFKDIRVRVIETDR